LRHVCLLGIAQNEEDKRTRAVEVEITELLSSSSSIIVSGATYQLRSQWKGDISLLESLMVLDETDQSLLLGDIDQFLVILDFLSSGLGNEDVMAEVQSFRSDWEMCRVGCEDDDC
jgi:hypothetical protein